MSGRTGSRPAPRPPAEPELTISEIRTSLAAASVPLRPYQTARTIFAFTWAACRPIGAGFAVIDVASNATEARAIALHHSGAVAAFRSLKLRVVEDDF